MGVMLFLCDIEPNHLLIVWPEYQASFAHTAIKNYALVKSTFCANLNELGARTEIGQQDT